MKRKEVISLLKREIEYIRESAIRSATMLAERDQNTRFYEEIKDIPTQQQLWFAYWLGREHGRNTGIQNAKIYMEQDGEAMVKALLKGFWVISP